MSDSPPAAKRQRPDDPEIVRSDVWYHDGSVVLQAGTTQFRVHWSVLSSHSSFFRDMEGLPQPQGEPKVEGCPIVELSDSAEDVGTVLKALYNPFLFAQKSLPLSVIASHIRLGRKYDLKEFLQSMVQRLTHENPRTLEEYDLLTPEDNPSLIDRYRGLLVDVVTLARENNLFALLPCAYLRVVLRLTQTELLDGVRRPDGSLAKLSPQDQRACILGHTELMRRQWNAGYTLGWLAQNYSRTGPAECTDDDSCTQHRLAVFHSHVLRATMAPLSAVKRVDQFSLCDACKEDGKRKMAEGRKKMWESLPSFFGLPPWAELKNDI